MPTSCVPVPSSAIARRDEEPWPGRTVHIFRCAEHPEEPATYFCATCECQCICADAEPKEAGRASGSGFGELSRQSLCVVQKDGRHRDHEVMRVARAHEVLKSRAGALLDEAVALEATRWCQMLNGQGLEMVPVV
eukprot:g706.t1